MTLIPRLPNAPQNYDAQNEAQFRGAVRQALQDVTSPGVGMASFDLDDFIAGVLGDTIVHNGTDWTATKIFLSTMHFNVDVEVAGIIGLYDDLQTQNQNTLFQEASAAAGTSGGLVDAGTYNYGWTDFSEFAADAGSGLTPSTVTLSGSSGAPYGIIDSLDAIEGLYYANSTTATPYALWITTWQGSMQYGEVLGRLWIDGLGSGLRVKGGVGVLGLPSVQEGPAVIFYTFSGSLRMFCCDLDGGFPGSELASGEYNLGGVSVAGWLWVRMRIADGGAGLVNFKVQATPTSAWPVLANAPPSVGAWQIDENSLTTINVAAASTPCFMVRTSLGPQQFSERRCSVFGFSGDSTFTFVAPGALPDVDSTSKHMIHRNIFSADTILQIKPKAGALGSNDAVAALKLIRETDADNREGLELFNSEASAVIAYGLKMTKTGTGSYGKFTFQWDDDVSLTVLSTDDGGGPLWTFADPVVMAGTFNVAGATTLDGAVTIGDATGDAFTINPSAWTLANAVTITGTWADLGIVTTVDINGGTIDGTIIGGAAAAAGTFTTLNATGGGALTGTWTDLGSVTTIDINGGTVDGTIIGGAAAAAGTFTTLNATGGGALTGTWTDMGSVTTIDINGGTVDGTIIGGAAAAAGTFTTLIATTQFAVGSVLDYALISVNASFTSGGGLSSAFGVLLAPALTAATGDTSWLAHYGVGSIIGTGSITTAGSTEAYTVAATMALAEPNVILGAGDSLAYGVTLYIANAPTEGGTANYSFWVNDGVSRFDGVIQEADGSISAPAYGFTTDFDTGMYLVSTGVLGFTVGGVRHTRLADQQSLHQVSGDGVGDHYSSSIYTDTALTRRWHFSARGEAYAAGERRTYRYFYHDGTSFNFITAFSWLNTSAQLLSADGTALLPLYSFHSDQDTGMYLVSTGVLGFSVSGIETMRIGTAGPSANRWLFTAATSVSGTVAQILTTATSGLVLVGGGGSSFDFNLVRGSDSSSIMKVATTTLNVAFGGSVTVAGDITSETGDVFIINTSTSQFTSAIYRSTTDETAGSEINVYTILNEKDTAGAGLGAADFIIRATTKTNAHWINLLKADASALTMTLLQGDSGGADAAIQVESWAVKIGTCLIATYAGITSSTFTGRMDQTQVGGSVFMRMFASDAAADVGKWDHRITASGNYEFRSITDAGATIKNALQLAHLTGNATFSGTLYGPNGSITAPTYSFTADTDTGMYLVGVGTLGFTTGGTEALRIDTNGVARFVNEIEVAAGGPTDPGYTFTGDTNTGLYSIGADQLGFTTGGTLRFSLSTATVTTTLPFRAANGSAAACSYSFSSGGGVGMYFLSSGLAFATASAIRLNLTSDGGVGLVDGITAPATAAGYALLYVDSADGDLKVMFGDGTVKTIVTDT